MNIQGYLFLQKHKLPLARNAVIFREIKEVPKSIFTDGKIKDNWVLSGYDDRMRISDGPYSQESIKKKGFKIKDIYMKFKELNEDLDKRSIPIKNRIFLLFSGYLGSNVKFSGHALRDKDKIYIDLLKGNRPSKSDWTPDQSLKYSIINRRAIPHNFAPGYYQDYLIEVVKDLLKLEVNGCLEFVILDDGYLFYNDFYTIS